MRDGATVESTRTGRVEPFYGVAIEQTRSRAVFLDRAEVLHRQARDLHADTAGLRRTGLMRELDDQQNLLAADDGRTLLERLGDLGFSWRDIAKISRVSVPAVQKWRKGEGITGANRLRLARIAALTQMLNERFISEPVSWLEMPVKDGVDLSRIQLLVDDRFDLVLELVSDDGDVVAVDPVLDEYNSNWRELLVDPNFEAYRADDGDYAIRPRA